MTRTRLAGRGGQRTSSLPELLSVEELANLLQVPVSTVYYWRLRGEGPKPIRIGKYLRFDSADVARWIEGRKTAS
ncbi:MAG TPA: helix-turn-helix domain-containing protein [Actinomycetota bacterium]|nr:helix-turn-helix domain-containing protein [Actinomycetota bacterium]